MLTEMKKADREKMISMVEELCRSKGATVSRVDPDLSGPKEIAVDIVIGKGRVTIDFDGSKGPHEDRDVYCMAWNSIHEEDRDRARMTPRFGHVVGSSVNPHHRAKCTGFARGIDELMNRLERAFDCILAGEAFETDARAMA